MYQTPVFQCSLPIHIPTDEVILAKLFSARDFGLFISNKNYVVIINFHLFEKNVN